MPTFTPSPEEEGVRLDIFLTSHTETSRSYVQKQIKAGDALVNKQPSQSNYKIQLEDEIYLPAFKPQAVIKKDIPVLDVISETDDYMVINKPAGLIVHKVNENDSDPTVVDALLLMRPEVADVGEDPIRPGIVHRLDKDVSGLMIIAKTEEMFQELKKQFQERTVEKTYIALCYGTLPKTNDRITMKIARSRSRGRMVARPVSQEGKDAITEYTVMQSFATTTLVEVKILTGRTHQIRVHFRAIDHPLVGDKLYKKKKMKNIRAFELDRIFLHAQNLSVLDLENKRVNFHLPLPLELQDFIQQLTSSS